VVLKQFGTQGTILSLSDDEAEVQVGTLRMRVGLDELKPREDINTGQAEILQKQKTKNEPVERPASIVGLHPSPGLELDLRGQRAEDALDMLDRYLEQAYLSGLPFVRIIHGKGTGKLRQEVRLMLKDHPHVTSFEEGGDKEGGAGVTVAKLAG
jgi:DNA mismatch repair protein MutS2